ncbi:transcriptional regulator, TetR family [Pseudomonas benzenivorans]|nr:TetR/AcrR family transcriptional regulator [Pseudomonas benzenivorans]SDI16234.1 transcriptional regulator, TetR family [Pseudomonas benzenivorans]
MSRYPRDRAENTRLDILESASVLFRRHGVARVSLFKIMAQISMTQGGFYKYFDSKEALAEEVCLHAFQQTQALWKTALEESSPLKDLIGQYICNARKGFCPLVSLGQDAADLPEGDSFARIYSTGAQSLLQTVVGAAQDQGVARSRDQALVYFAAMVGVAHLARSVSPEAWVEEIEAALLEQLTQ